MIFLSIILSPKKSFSFTDLLARQFTVTAASLAPNPIKDILFQDIDLIAERAQVPFTYGLHVVNAPDRSIKQLRKSILGICRHHPGELNYNKRARFGTLSGLVIKYIALLYTYKSDQTLFFAYHDAVNSYWNVVPKYLAERSFKISCTHRIELTSAEKKLINIANYIGNYSSVKDLNFLVNYIVQNIVDFWIILYTNYGLNTSLIEPKRITKQIEINDTIRIFAGSSRSYSRRHSKYIPVSSEPEESEEGSTEKRLEELEAQKEKEKRLSQQKKRAYDNYQDAQRRWDNVNKYPDDLPKSTYDRSKSDYERAKGEWERLQNK